MTDKTILQIASISMAMAIAFGALGAHALKNHLGLEAIEGWKSAVLYQLIHSISLILLVFISRNFNLDVKFIGILFIVGMLVFSGSIYILTLNKIWEIPNLSKVMGPITPLGGLILISSWILLFFRVLKSN